MSWIFFQTTSVIIYKIQNWEKLITWKVEVKEGLVGFHSCFPDQVLPAKICNNIARHLLQQVKQLGALGCITSESDSCIAVVRLAEEVSELNLTNRRIEYSGSSWRNWR